MVKYNIMHQFRTRKTFRDFLYSPVAIALLIVLAFFLVRIVWGSFVGYREAARARAVAEARALELEEEEARASARAEAAGSARAAEEEIREKLRMALPGEEVIVITDEENFSRDEILADEETSLWQRFVDWVINI